MRELPEDDQPLMTRKAAVEHVNKKLGIPLKLSTFNKKAMSASRTRITFKDGRAAAS